MAETQGQGKRQRDDETLIVAAEEEEELQEDPKRRKSYNQILSFLDEEDQDDYDSNQDVSSIFTTLQRELSFDSIDEQISDPVIEPVLTTESGRKCPDSVKDEEDRLMKRLLEATDDELGIPNGPVVTGGNYHELVMDGGDELGLLSSCGDDIDSGGLWELEDEAANYYTWFQSELFM